MPRATAAAPVCVPRHVCPGICAARAGGGEGEGAGEEEEGAAALLREVADVDESIAVTTTRPARVSCVLGVVAWCVRGAYVKNDGAAVFLTL